MGNKPHGQGHKDVKVRHGDDIPKYLVRKLSQATKTCKVNYVWVSHHYKRRARLGLTSTYAGISSFDDKNGEIWPLYLNVAELKSHHIVPFWYKAGIL